MKNLLKFEYKITILYLILGFSWIFFSDKAIQNLFPSDIITRIQTYKGGFFILFTAILLFLFVRRNTKKINNANHLLIKKNAEYETVNEELKEANTELLKAKDKAEESNRFKTAFLHNMSHEIRTPMNAIHGFSELLSNPHLPEEKRLRYTSIIQNSCNQLLSIVTNILTISSIETKQEKSELTSVCINDIIRDLYIIFNQKAIKQGIALNMQLELTDDQSVITTDKTKVIQILTNLLTNAFKFTHHGFIDFGYRFISDKEQGVLEFFVKDCGIGIKPEFHTIIFERFRQAEAQIQENYGGTGLGLSISKAFVELLGGKIRVESEPDKGSCFFFTLPYHHVPIEPTIASAVFSSNLRKTILVAEDEEINFILIEDLLIDMGHKVLRSKNGKEAVDICLSNAPVDLVFMDIKMPVMDGYTAAKLIKNHRPELPLIAQSAYALENEIEKYQSVFDDYLTKPLKIDELKSILVKYLKVN